MDEITHLNWWTSNARKWREANGFVTSEWIEYKNNTCFNNVCCSTLAFLFGIAFGIAMCIS